MMSWYVLSIASCSTLLRLHSHVNDLVERLKSSLKIQCEQCGTMSVCGEHIGAPLVSMETGEIISKEQIENAVRSGDDNLVIKDPATGLLLPGGSTKMKIANGSSKNVPLNYAINPNTGHVVPIQGNVCFDVISHQLVFTCDSLHRRDATSIVLRDSPMIPYIPHPLNPETGEPVETGLKVMEKQSELRLGCPTLDPVTGLVVPVCAVTIHPRSHSLLPVGGTYIDPVSTLPVPIELGSMLLDPVTNLPVPVVSITFDVSSGRIKPVGGTVTVQERDSTETSQKTILIGEAATEPLSQLPVRVTSAVNGIKDEGSTLESAYGGYQTYLDSVELTQERTLIKTLVYLQDLGLAISDNTGDKFLFFEELQKVHSLYKKLTQTQIKNQALQLTNLHSLLVKKESSDKLASTGGSPGYMEFKPTGQPLPLLLGHSIPDEVEGVKVPVLGYELYPVTGVAEPLAGTFESANGRIPITIGEKAYNEATQELAPICGVKKNPENGVVVPSFQEPLYVIQAKKKTVSKSLVSFS